MFIGLNSELGSANDLWKLRGVWQTEFATLDIGSQSVDVKSPISLVKKPGMTEHRSTELTPQ